MHTRYTPLMSTTEPFRIMARRSGAQRSIKPTKVSILVETIVSPSSARPRFAFICVTAVVGALLFSAPSFATFMVLSGNNPDPTEENILFGDDLVGMTIQGTTNQSNRVVEFESPSQFLSSKSSGAARIEARESDDIDSEQVAINDSITVSLANPGLSFGDLIFNAFNGGQLGDGGTLTIVVSGFESNGDPVSTTFTEDSDGDPLTLGNGAKFFTVVASDGQRITSVTISPDAESSYADLRQIRISGIIPEPASWLLLGVGGMMFAARRWRTSACGSQSTCGK